MQPMDSNYGKIPDAWRVRVSVEVEGPKEGPIILSADYIETTREIAETLQNMFLKMGLELNTKGIKK